MTVEKKAREEPIVSAQQLQREARRYAHKAIAKLAKWVESDDPKASIPAAKELLNRGYGAAPQFIELSESRADVQQMSDEQLDAMHKKLQQFALLKKQSPELFEQVMEVMQSAGDPKPAAEVQRVQAKVEIKGNVIDMASNRAMTVVCRSCANRWVGVKGPYKTIVQARKAGHVIKCPRCGSENALKDTRKSR
jgi:predicted nucleic-acid-binding Zn-ribbon protein